MSEVIPVVPPLADGVESGLGELDPRSQGMQGQR